MHKVTIDDIKALPVGESLIYFKGSRYIGCQTVRRHLLAGAGLCRIGRRPGENTANWYPDPNARQEFELKQELVSRFRNHGVFNYIVKRVAVALASATSVR